MAHPRLVRSERGAARKAAARKAWTGRGRLTLRLFLLTLLSATPPRNRPTIQGSALSSRQRICSLCHRARHVPTRPVCEKTRRRIGGLPTSRTHATAMDLVTEKALTPSL